MAYLEITTREGIQRHQLNRDRLSLGRLSYNDVVLANAQISRQHAELRYLNGDWWIADLHSTNGLHIGSRRVQEHRLSSGDTLTLAPDVTIRFIDDGIPPSAASGARGATPQPGLPPQQPGMSPAAPGQPVPLSQSYPSLKSLAPRSPFADDEVPYVPPGMGLSAGPTISRERGVPTRPANPGAPARPPAGNGGFPPPGGPPVGMPPGGEHGYGGYGSGASPGQLGGNDALDPYRRNQPGGEHSRATAGPASTLLHVCQTCGQRTAPDAVYCQNCHQSIAYECSNCRLSLLPIQDRCPRCQTPNPASVRRSQRASGL